MTDSTNKSKVDLGLLEEDDEFEEFPAEGMLSCLEILKMEIVLDIIFKVKHVVCNLVIILILFRDCVLH